MAIARRSLDATDARWRDDSTSTRVAHVVVKIAERCNLNCGYCYMYNHADQTYRARPPFMSAELFECLVGRVKQHLASAPASKMSLTFHGGEPMLIDAAVFRRMLEHAATELGDRVDFSIQTNATLVSRAWIRILEDYDVAVSVSIDGLPQAHDRWRVFHDGRGSYEAVIGGFHALQRAGIEPSVACVAQAGADGLATYRHLRSLGVKLFGFKFPDLCHDRVDRRIAPAGATPMADFLVPIFDAWYVDNEPDVRIKQFEAIIRGILGGRPVSEEFGGGGVDFLVVESDGSIHGSDGLRVCENGMSSSGLNITRHSFDDLRLGSPLIYRLSTDGLPVATACRSCPEVEVCRSGRAAHRYSRANGFDNPSVWCADLLRIITHIRRVVTGDDPIEETIGWAGDECHAYRR